MRVSTVLLAGTASLALAAPVQKEEKRASKFEFFGVNESGPEFGEGNLPGTLNTDYVWPTLSTIDTFVNKGMNTIRVNILMERLTQGSMTASLDATYLADLKKVCSTHAHLRDLKTDACTPDGQLHHQLGCLCHDRAPQLWP